MQHRGGFSRIGVLVTVMVLVVLVATILPAVQHARESARRQVCRQHLWKLGLALQMYHDTCRSFPLGSIGSSKLPPEKRWSFYTLLGNNTRHYGWLEVDWNCAWDDPELRPLRLHTWRNAPYEEFDVPLHSYPDLHCPSSINIASNSDGQPFVDYIGLGGVGSDGLEVARTHPRAGIFSYTDFTRLRDITDGTSNTLMLMETARPVDCWLAGGPASVRTFDPNDKNAIGIQGQFGSYHARHGKGMNTVFADAEVRYVNEDIDVNVLAALCTIAGQKPIDQQLADRSPLKKRINASRPF